MSTTAPIALISGANTGIGLAVATQLAKNYGFHVIIGSRNAAAGEEAATILTGEGFSASSVQLDLRSDESIATAVETVKRKFGVLDVLINNAGILIDHVAGLTDEYKDLSTRERYDQTFGTNVIGTVCLTEAFLPLLRKSQHPRLIFVSSIMGSFAESLNKSTMFYNIDYRCYDSSKAAVNMLGLNYAKFLEKDGFLVNVVCPGLVKTKLTKYMEYGAPTDVGAKRIVELATAQKGDPTMTYTSREGVIAW